MGHSSKKKKKRGGGGGGRRTQSKNQNSISANDNEILAEELTALASIFQEDCQVSESPPEIKIKLSPYSKDTGYEECDISAVLSVRYLQGYPYKCPKLHIIPEKGLLKADADNLLSLLYDQANSNAREGRVMIYSLVEAAQEFLSEIVPQEKPHNLVKYGESEHKDTLVPSGTIFSLNKPFVYSRVDLFCGSGGSWHWNIEMNENNKIASSHAFKGLKKDNLDLKEQLNLHTNPALAENDGATSLHKPSLNLGIVKEDSNEDSKSTDLSTSESDGKGNNVEDIFVKGNITSTEDSDWDSELSESLSSESVTHNQLEQHVKSNLLLAHLLRLICSSRGPLADALPEITSELVNLGIVSEGVQELAIKPSSSFDKIFDRVFRQHILSSKNIPFWKTASPFGAQSSTLSSRYLNDFEELQTVGHGGFGHVVLCKNKLDGRHYAVKKIRLKDKSLPVNDRILREVATLSRLQHQHVVRYYQAWYETGVVEGVSGAAQHTKTGLSSSFSYKEASSSDLLGHEKKLESTYLYIQMEYCPRTLKEMLQSYNHFDKELAWHLFRQIVEGLAHIHAQGIIHRDLTPNNIFFDARNDIKIGDFGLAKFLKLEQQDQDMDATDTVGVSIDGTGQIGTYFYTAPEIEHGWPKINEKVDMYSLAIVFFELWHPFDTAMERHIVLSELKQKGEIPALWVNEYPEQASLLRVLMSLSPSNRPSASELLKHYLPPRMEYELLNNMLRTIHSSEDRSIYEQLVSAFFDDDMLSTKDNQENVGRLKLAQNDTSSVIFTDVDTANRNLIMDIAVKVFRQHCAKHLEILPMRILGDFLQSNRSSVKLLTHGGDMVELCDELRFPFVKWIIANQKMSFKRYEVSYVYRKAIGHSPPTRYLQGDFDIVGGAAALTEAEVIKATMDIATHFFHAESCDIHLNHGDLLEAIWSWTGIKCEKRQKVAEILSLLGSLRPQSSERKSKWVVIRRQLRQELGITDDVLNRLQTVGLRFCGLADQALPRLRGALPADKSTHKALDDLSEVFNYLRVWRIDKEVFLDALLPPTENYHRNLYFQIYLRKENNFVSSMEGILLGVGGRYDYLLQKMADSGYKSNPPGAVGTSIALETILLHSTFDSKFYRNESGISVLVCSRGGGGLLSERMELVSELWKSGIKAEFVPSYDPSLTEQYEYANEHDIKCLIVITNSGVSQNGSLKVRHLELKKEKEVEREGLVRFLLDAMASQFRNPSIWS